MIIMEEFEMIFDPEEVSEETLEHLSNNEGDEE